MCPDIIVHGHPHVAETRARLLIVRAYLRAHPVVATVDDEGVGTHGTIAAAAKDVRSRLIKEENFKENCVSDGVLEQFTSTWSGDPSVDAIVGGVLAQDVVRAITHAGKPIHNFFCFSTSDGGGWALPIAVVPSEDAIPAPAAAEAIELL